MNVYRAMRHGHRYNGPHANLSWKTYLMRKFFLALLPLLLTACVRDSATYYADSSNEHTLTIRREQEYFWVDDAKVTLMAARLPDCQRQIPLTDMPLDEVEIELFASGDNQWSLRAGSQVWQLETQSCALLAEGGVAAGERVGVFKSDGEKMVFEPATDAAASPVPQAAAAAAPDAATQAAPAAEAPAAQPQAN